MQQPEIAKEFHFQVGGAFAPLMDLEVDVDELYNSFKNVTNKVTKEVVGYKKAKQLENMNMETAHLCEKRRAARIKLIQNPRSEIHQETYGKLNKEVKKAVKRIKTENLQKKVLSLEEDFKTNNSIIFNLFKTERELEGRQRKSLTMVKDRQGKKHSKLHEVMVCWEEHFKMHLNTGIPHDPDSP